MLDEYKAWARTHGGINEQQIATIVNLAAKLHANVNEICAAAMKKPNGTPDNLISVMKEHLAEIQREEAAALPKVAVVSTQKIEFKPKKPLTARLSKIKTPKINIGGVWRGVTGRISEVRVRFRKNKEEADEDESPAQAESVPQGVTKVRVPVWRQAASETASPQTDPPADTSSEESDTESAPPTPEANRSFYHQGRIHGQKPGLTVTGRSIGDRFNSIKYLASTWGKWIVIGLVILIILVGGYLLISQAGQIGYTSPSEINQALATPPAPPTQTPVDLAHVNWLSIVQATIVLLSLLALVGLGVDAWNRGQISDFIAVFFGIAMIMIHGLLTTMFSSPLAWLNMTYTQLDWAFSFFCIGVAFSAAWWVTQQGGFDLTPLASFFTLLGASGLLFGHMGAIQVFFNIPDAAVLPMNQVATLISLKQTDQIGMSLLTYVSLGIGAILYIVEMIRTIVQEISGAGAQFFYAATSVVGLVVYFAFKNFLLARGTPPMVIITLAILAGAAAAFAYRVINKRSNTPISKGEIRLRNAWIPAWDKLVVQIAIALLLIAMTGRVF